MLEFEQKQHFNRSNNRPISFYVVLRSNLVLLEPKDSEKNGKIILHEKYIKTHL